VEVVKVVSVAGEVGDVDWECCCCPFERGTFV
jgi:hypothetical protein